MQFNIKTEDIFFLTTNPQKTKDFEAMGFGVMKNDNEPEEILSPYSAEVALYKSKDTNINHVVVEDTSLWIEKSPFLGTQIKDYWQIVANDEKYHGKHAIWEISICLSLDDHFIVSTGVTHGIIKFPKIEDAYHFNQVFAVPSKNPNEDFIHFELLTDEQKEAASPRNKAVLQLKEAILKNDYSNLQIINKSEVPEWKGSYQSDKLVSKIMSGKIPKIR